MLAAQIGIEHGVVVSLLDHLCSQYVVEEVAPEEYVGTAIADTYNSIESETAFTCL
jgi:hypothetical protein